jgi:molecular chaperone DnaK (HSP70)
MWWSVALVVLAIFFLLGLLFWKFEMGLARSAVKRSQKEFDRRQEAEKAKVELDRQRAMLYEDMTVDEAQQIIWAWEEMTEEERSDLPLEKRVEFRRISSDLEEHRRRWNLERGS